MARRGRYALRGATKALAVAVALFVFDVLPSTEAFLPGGKWDSPALSVPVGSVGASYRGALVVESRRRVAGHRRTAPSMLASVQVRVGFEVPCAYSPGPDGGTGAGLQGIQNFPSR